MEELSPEMKLKLQSLGENPDDRESDFRLFREACLQHPRYKSWSEDGLRMLWNRWYPRCSIPLSTE